MSVPESHTCRVLGCLWACTALGVVVYVCSLHDRLRRAATFSGWLAAIITALFFGIEVWVNTVPGANAPGAEQRFLLDVVVRTCEWLLSVLNVAWVVFLFFLVLMNIADVVATQIWCRFKGCKSPGPLLPSRLDCGDFHDFAGNAHRHFDFGVLENLD